MARTGHLTCVAQIRGIYMDRECVEDGLQLGAGRSANANYLDLPLAQTRWLAVAANVALPRGLSNIAQVAEPPLICFAWQIGLF